LSSYNWTFLEHNRNISSSAAQQINKSLSIIGSALYREEREREGNHLFITKTNFQEIKKVVP
jgi:hypothetical protein